MIAQLLKVQEYAHSSYKWLLKKKKKLTLTEGNEHNVQFL